MAALGRTRIERQICFGQVGAALVEKFVEVPRGLVRYTNQTQRVTPPVPLVSESELGETYCDIEVMNATRRHSLTVDPFSSIQTRTDPAVVPVHYCTRSHSYDIGLARLTAIACKLYLVVNENSKVIQH